MNDSYINLVYTGFCEVMRCISQRRIVTWDSLHIRPDAIVAPKGWCTGMSGDVAYCTPSPLIAALIDMTSGGDTPVNAHASSCPSLIEGLAELANEIKAIGDTIRVVKQQRKREMCIRDFSTIYDLLEVGQACGADALSRVFIEDADRPKHADVAMALFVELMAVLSMPNRSLPVIMNPSDNNGKYKYDFGYLKGNDELINLIDKVITKTYKPDGYNPVKDEDVKAFEADLGRGAPPMFPIPRLVGSDLPAW